MAGPVRAVGHPDHSSTGASKFIPQVWSGKLVEKFYNSTVFGSIANTDYEGEISQMGDTVIIRTVPDVTIFDYQIGGGITYENLTSNNTSLDIDQAKGFAFTVNDIDKYQSDITELDSWSDETGNKMKTAIDLMVLSSVHLDAAAFNSGATAGRISGDLDFGVTGTAVPVTKLNVIDKITEMGQALDEANVPDMGRWLVAPAWFCSRIKRSELTDASLSGDGVSMSRNGRVGIVDRFEIYMSNQVNQTVPGEFDMLFGHPAAITFASQMVNMEDLRNPNDYGQLVRGLNVFGVEVINDTALGHFVGRAA